MNNEYAEFEELLNEYLPMEQAKEHSKVKGVIAQKDRNYAYLDVKGQPTTVRVKSEEVNTYDIGSEIEIILMGETDEGDFIIGSRKRIDIEENWKNIENAFEKKDILKAKIMKKIKGGYILECLFHQGFLPNSLSEISSNDDVLGKEIDVVVKDIQIDKNGKSKKIMFSRKDITLQKEREEFSKLKVGDIVEGEILEVLNFGLAVKIACLRGFVHISEISWKKVDDLSKLYKKGEIIKGVIISLEPEKRNIKLSIKNLTENPWEAFSKKAGVNSEVEGKVTKILPYGVFVEVADGVEGLVHMTDFIWGKKSVNLSNFVKIGDTIKVKVLEFSLADRKLKLGIKQLSENPWDKADEKFGLGKELEVKVVDIKPFGLFAEIEQGVDIFIHQNDYKWQLEENKKFNLGDKIFVKVIEIDKENKKLKGSIKALTKNPFEIVLENYKIGQTVETPIKNITNFGLFVALTDVIDGFIPIQMVSKDFIKKLEDKFKVGDIVKAQIIEVDRDKERIKLSIKKIEIEEEKRENQELISKYGVSSSGE